MLILILAVLVLAAWVHAGPLAATSALIAAAFAYCLIVLVSIHHRCPSCRGRRVTGKGRRVRGCRRCKGTGKTRRRFAGPVHRLAWTIAGPSLKARLEQAHERAREKAGYLE